MSRLNAFGSPRHLVTRFVGSLWPAGPSPDDEDWARRLLLPGEQALWGRMSGPDRRHAVGVARSTVELLGGDGSRPVLASALLHDVGKVESGLGAVSRALVTAAAMVVGREKLAATPEPSVGERAWRRRARQYLTHDRLGADLLEQAGSDPLTVAWAAEHHREPSRWTLERHIADALKAADDD